jgi:hypothetical protein
MYDFNDISVRLPSLTFECLQATYEAVGLKLEFIVNVGSTLDTYMLCGGMSMGDCSVKLRTTTWLINSELLSNLCSEAVLCQPGGRNELRASSWRVLSLARTDLVAVNDLAVRAGG